MIGGRPSVSQGWRLRKSLDFMAFRPGRCDWYGFVKQRTGCLDLGTPVGTPVEDRTQDGPQAGVRRAVLLVQRIGIGFRQLDQE